MGIKITGTFKSYDDLLEAFGTDPDKEIDSGFDGAMKTIADKDCILVNYSPKYKTFDATLKTERLNDPSDPAGGTHFVMDIPFGTLRRYTENLGTNTLVDGSISCDGCDDVIFCTGCGFSASKGTRYDYEPKFSYGDIYNKACKEDPAGNKSGAVITLNACDDNGNMFCPACLSMQPFKEVSTSL